MQQTQGKDRNALIVLDGGMGGELIRRGVTGGDGLWSAQALVEQPDKVLGVHRDYIDAGAQVIITNSYSTIPSYLAKGGLEDKYVEYTKLAGEIARRAVDESGKDVKVAGSIPPLNESYRYDLVPPEEEAAPIYQCLVEALNPYVDLFVCETMSCVREARTAVAAASTHGQGKPVWVAWTLHEEPGQGLRSRETVTEAYAAVAQYSPEAYLFNCSTSESITPALKELSTLTDCPIGVYPNLLHIPENWTLDNDVVTGYREMAVADYVDFANRWRRQGASIIGGCCGIGPKYIAALADAG